MKKVKYLIVAAVIAVALVIAGVVIKKEREVVYFEDKVYQAGEDTEIPGTGDYEDGQIRMMALADTEEEAEEIAELYQMELISYTNGVAIYLTDQNPQELIAYGEEQGYPVIEPDQRVSISGETEYK